MEEELSGRCLKISSLFSRTTKTDSLRSIPYHLPPVLLLRHLGGNEQRAHHKNNTDCRQDFSRHRGRTSFVVHEGACCVVIITLSLFSPPPNKRGAVYPSIKPCHSCYDTRNPCESSKVVKKGGIKPRPEIFCCKVWLLDTWLPTTNTGWLIISRLIPTFLEQREAKEEENWRNVKKREREKENTPITRGGYLAYITILLCCDIDWCG